MGRKQDLFSQEFRGLDCTSPVERLVRKFWLHKFRQALNSYSPCYQIFICPLDRQVNVLWAGMRKQVIMYFMIITLRKTTISVIIDSSVSKRLENTLLLPKDRTQVYNYYSFGITV